jgi:hypothetical protein
LRKLAENDELGNSAAHFFKSGNVLRNTKSDHLITIRDKLPDGWRGTKIEYDLWYNFSDKKIHGYVYTDLLTKFIYIRAASEEYAMLAMQQAANSEITAEGEALYNDIAQNNEDKYRLRSTEEQHEFVIFLPGTNILDRVTDWPKVERAMAQGAKLKCHPLTSPTVYQHLLYKYGRENVIEKKKSGKKILDQAAIVGCCENSEMGLAALAKSKKVYLFGKRNEWCTYTAIYRALERGGSLQADLLKAVLSSESSGLISANVSRCQDNIMSFFDQYIGVEHVAPRSFGDRVQQAAPTNS